jgi:hypothetical protein
LEYVPVGNAGVRALKAESDLIAKAMLWYTRLGSTLWTNRRTTRCGRQAAQLHRGRPTWNHTAGHEVQRCRVPRIIYGPEYLLRQTVNNKST